MRIKKNTLARNRIAKEIRQFLANPNTRNHFYALGYLHATWLNDSESMSFDQELRICENMQHIANGKI